MKVHEPIRYVAKNMRLDQRLIADMVAPGARVLDIGSGDGTLLEYLARTRGCDARGIELDMAEGLTWVRQNHLRWKRIWLHNSLLGVMRTTSGWYRNISQSLGE